MATPAAKLPEVHAAEEAGHDDESDSDEELEWSEEQCAVIAAMERGESILLTGPAGCGKTAVTKHIIETFTRRRMPVLVSAMTGIAAINISTAAVSARTIHSVLRLPVKDLEHCTPEQIADSIMRRPDKVFRDSVRNARLLVIDEVSMMQPTLFEQVCVVLQRLRGNYEAFGGIQLLLVGDFAQLPPVNRGGYGVVPAVMYTPDLAAVALAGAGAGAGVGVGTKRKADAPPAGPSGGAKRSTPSSAHAEIPGAGFTDEELALMLEDEPPATTVAAVEEEVKEPVPDATFIFQTRLFLQTIKRVFDLRQVYRQPDPAFAAALNRIRFGKQTAADLDLLRPRVGTREALPLGEPVDGIRPTHLDSNNADVDEMNAKELSKLRTPEHVFPAYAGCEQPADGTGRGRGRGSRGGRGRGGRGGAGGSRDDFVEVTMDKYERMREALVRDSGVGTGVTLKVGAQVMLTFNLDVASGLANGSRGIIERFVDAKHLAPAPAPTEPDGGSSSRKPKSPEEVARDADRAVFSKPPVDDVAQYYPASGMVAVVRFQGRPTAVQIPYVGLSRLDRASGARAFVWFTPLRAAWAVTIHKSQGLSLDRVSLSMRRIFAAGQAYTALSRVRTLTGIKDPKTGQMVGGLRLADFNPTCIKASPEVVLFYDSVASYTADRRAYLAGLRGGV